MSALDWHAEDLVVGRAEAAVLNHAFVSMLANEDLDPDFHAGELVEQARVSRPAARAALRRLVDRGWLAFRLEDDFSAREEARPARTYYRLTEEGRRVVLALLGPKSPV